MTNKISAGFLKKYSHGPRGKVVYLPLKSGFLVNEYNDSGELLMVHYRLRHGGLNVGMGLEFNGDEVTYISEMGMSGLQWSDGKVNWGTTFEDENGTIMPDDGKAQKISKDKWVDQMIYKIINPDKEEIEDIKKIEEEDKKYGEADLEEDVDNSFKF